MRLALDRLRDFLRQHSFDDFSGGEDFADQLLERMESGFANGWAGTRARTAIRDVTKSTYEFYRLKDRSPFGGEKPPLRLQLGGPDRRSIRFIEDLDHFYFSKFANNTSEPLRKFFTERFFRNGALLFDENSTAWKEFRDLSGERFKNLTFRQTGTIIETATARVRNWAHIRSLQQIEVEYAEIIATLDARTTELCRELDGKIFRVGVAAEAIDRLIKLEPGEFAKELYESPIGKAISKDPVNTIRQFIEPDGKTISDDLVSMGRGFPPYHPNCRTRTALFTKGINDSEDASEGAGDEE